MSRFQIALILSIVSIGMCACIKLMTQDSRSLSDARKNFETVIIECDYQPYDSPPSPPDGILELTEYESDGARFACYVSPDPGDGRKHPAVVWLHGGFG